MDTLQKAFDEAIKQMAHAVASEQELEELSRTVPAQMEEILSRLPADMLHSIKGMANEGLKERRDLHCGFVERNVKRWQEAFDLFELHIAIAIEAGELFNKRSRPDAVVKNDLLFDVLVRLHAKGCMISQEIACLLKNGFADGAHARWRALHETAVTSMFLSKNGNDAAERYLYHELVESYKGASQHRKYQSRLNAVGLNDKEFTELKAEYERVVDHYGKKFKSPYGWARPYLKSGNENFAALEEAVGLDHWRPYYKWASQNVHANVKSIKYSLGLSETKEDVLLVGTSNSGMTDPAHSTAISLSQLTINLLLYSPNIDGLVMMKMLLSLCDEIGDEFVRCDKKHMI